MDPLGVCADANGKDLGLLKGADNILPNKLLVSGLLAP